MKNRLYNSELIWLKFRRLPDILEKYNSLKPYILTDKDLESKVECSVLEELQSGDTLVMWYIVFYTVNKRCIDIWYHGTYQISPPSLLN